MAIIKVNISFYKLSDWSIIDEYDYKAPITADRRRALLGKRDGDSMKTTTTPIVEAKGRVILTLSGSIYVLGAIDPAFFRFIGDEGIQYDYDNPITNDFLEMTRKFKTYSYYSTYNSTANYSNTYNNTSAVAICPLPVAKPIEKHF